MSLQDAPGGAFLCAPFPNQVIVAWLLVLGLAFALVCAQ